MATLRSVFIQYLPPRFGNASLFSELSGSIYPFRKGKKVSQLRLAQLYSLLSVIGQLLVFGFNPVFLPFLYLSIQREFDSLSRGSSF